MNFIRSLTLLTLFSNLYISSLSSEEPWGQGSSLEYCLNQKKPLAPMESFMGIFFEKTIAFHRDVISPVDGPRSHYRPTSSRFMLYSMRKHGVISGFIRGCDRLIRENSEKWVYRTIIIDGQEYKYDPY